ncbi:enoyl-CoA hydratase [Oleomonas cavernae]|uniref:Enoyl-CoA hydratase n=1 Tax=Oleomonas cavernae TaxID=2320859 RepID=A0A418WTZ0_9PROT|nr:crotonase/enoyl-CoA hydratase family protein [Oleomonas cavernae]RJF94724.1 enoyl-CoA hydratase [Oleomonas cavernae]
MSVDDATGRISVERRGQVLLIGLDRPAKRNGLTPEMFEALNDAYTLLEDDPALWVGILHAHGDHFTGGIDLPRFAARMADGGDLPHAPDKVDAFALRGRPRTKPVIAAVKGICFTAGIELMLAADIVVAGSDCRFAQIEPKRGIMATGGATFRFVERAGWGNAMRWLLTGSEFGPQEAQRIGFVQEIVEPAGVLDRALEIAGEITDKAPLAVRATRRNAMTYALEGQAAAIAQFREIQQTLARSQDAREGVMSFIEKRPPVFSGT